jgi:diguanylate cyclase (GGDEF)-like protein
VRQELLDIRSIAATGSLALLGIGVLIARVVSKRDLRELRSWNFANTFVIAFLGAAASRGFLPLPLSTGLAGGFLVLGLACLADASDALLSRRRRRALVLGGSLAAALLLSVLPFAFGMTAAPASLSSLLAFLSSLTAFILCAREARAAFRASRELRAREGPGALAALFGAGALAFAVSSAICASAAFGWMPRPVLPLIEPLFALGTAVLFVAVDLALLIVLMSSIESAVATKVLELGESKNNLQLLYDAFTETAGSTDLEELLPSILDLLRLRLHVDMSALYLCEPGGNELPLVAQRGLSPEALAALNGPEQATSLAWQSYVEIRALVRRVEDYPEGPIKDALAALGLGVIGGFPIALHGEALGAMTIGYQDASALDELKLTLLETLSLQLGSVVRAASLHDGLSRANARLDTLASTDALTGIANRRVASRFLQREAARASRSGGSLVVLMCDIDHFKIFNDEHGHDCGDFVLAEVAGALAQGLRATDLAARWGGEEFLVILGPPSEAEAVGDPLALAERLRRRIEESSWEYEGERLSVTLTIGVAVCAAGTGYEEAVAMADSALYEGKRRGRNRISARGSAGILLPSFEEEGKAGEGPAKARAGEDEASDLLPVEGGPRKDEAAR